MDSYGESIFNDVLKLKPVVWLNRNMKDSRTGIIETKIKREHMYEAEKRLNRFAPLIKRLFPETGDGIIESPLVEIKNMKKSLEKEYLRAITGRLFLKCDSHLKVAGSVKARGGIYEVLKHAEELAIGSRMLRETDDYSRIGDEAFRKLFSQYKIAVGSTGNLGLSIGIMSASLGFKVTVHMSRDAKEWKKALLREKGVTVIEYEDDYSKAVEEGRKQCSGDPKAYFVDDENSLDLFLGYSVAAIRLKRQLDALNINIDKYHKLHIYIPCGVGGAPGGITYGIKEVFGDNALCYFAEPTHAPGMLLGLLTGKHENIHVRDYEIDNITEADGLAVGSPSKIASNAAELLLNAEYTIEDKELFKLLAMLKDEENIKVEASAAAGLMGPGLFKSNVNDIHIAWATGGLFLPEDLYNEAYKTGKNLI